jgi:hypothetical protein
MSVFSSLSKLLTYTQSPDFLSADSGLKSTLYVFINTILNRYEPMQYSHKFYQNPTLLKFMKVMTLSKDGNWTFMSLLIDWFSGSSKLEESPTNDSEDLFSYSIIEILKGLKDTLTPPVRKMDINKERYFPPNYDRINQCIERLTNINSTQK